MTKEVAKDVYNEDRPKLKQKHCVSKKNEKKSKKDLAL